MLISLWIPILVTLAAIILLIVLRGLFWTYISLAVIGTWLIYLFDKGLETFASGIATGNLTTLVFALFIVAGILLYLKYRGKRK